MDGASGIREPWSESERSDMATASVVDAANDAKGAVRRGRGAFSMHTLGHLEDRHLPVVATATTSTSRKSESASLRGPHQSAESLTLDPRLPATTTVTCSSDMFHSSNIQSHTRIDSVRQTRPARAQIFSQATSHAAALHPATRSSTDLQPAARVESGEVRASGEVPPAASERR